ncbi:MAG: hypothetical protein CVV64_05245 [Candidatus Wallbacteria bacterium HGW-Wallbacteria-1]|jgi:histidinol phosphatase-like PHP family hydrolase|uniref:Polymerase/histidinol phosphatase N-terminal domain-containing protein n=1 Tax=Candidatus Wallbacteria bacterium HGW-Wallbacteria-1 TaxID=2013854 RepID=A0A2N1PS65_9BACT|nr:MAG: hypothetical protein CVV64_05245 [Candidatus Wallbacteria bacterium HGW-Wallbacteria-1]
MVPKARNSEKTDDFHKMNLHIHTPFSDGTISGDEIVRIASENGLHTLGICDHFETTKVENSVSLTNISEYTEEIENWNQNFNGKILKGLEIDSNPSRTDLESLVQIPRTIDYLLFEYVGKAGFGGLALQSFLNLRRSLPHAVGLAHTRLSETFRGIDPQKAASILGENHIFVEITGGERNKVLNVSGNERIHLFEADRIYFQAFRNSPVKLSIGTDCHHVPTEIWDIQPPLNFIAELDLWKNLIIP